MELWQALQTAAAVPRTGPRAPGSPPDAVYAQHAHGKRRREQRQTAQQRLRRRSEWTCRVCGKANFLANTACRGCSTTPTGYERVTLGEDLQPATPAPAFPPPAPPSPPATTAQQATGGPPAARVQAVSAKPASRLDEARACLDAAVRAGMPKEVIDLLTKERDEEQQKVKDARPLGGRLDSAQATCKKCDARLEKARDALAKAKEELMVAKREAEQAAEQLEKVKREAAAQAEKGQNTAASLQTAIQGLIDAMSSTWLPAHSLRSADGLPSKLASALDVAQRALTASKEATVPTYDIDDSQHSDAASAEDEDDDDAAGMEDDEQQHARKSAKVRHQPAPAEQPAPTPETDAATRWLAECSTTENHAAHAAVIQNMLQQAAAARPAATGHAQARSTPYGA